MAKPDKTLSSKLCQGLISSYNQWKVPSTARGIFDSFRHTKHYQGEAQDVETERNNNSFQLVKLVGRKSRVLMVFAYKCSLISNSSENKFDQYLNSGHSL